MLRKKGEAGLRKRAAPPRSRPFFWEGPVTRFSPRGFIWLLLGLAVFVSAYYALAYYLITR